MTSRPVFFLVLATACGAGTSPPSPPPPAAAAPAPATVASASPAAKAPELATKTIALPGVTGNAFLDYIAFEPGTDRVWVPVGTGGSVDVLAIAAGTFTRIDGFGTAEREVRGKKRTLGPSAVSLGPGFAYVGNRATSEICPVDTKTLKAGKCLKLTAGIDGVAYVGGVKEVWVTMPKENALAVLDASQPDALAKKTEVKVGGAPEGYAVDEAHGVFYTNLEDKGPTVGIDVKTHAVKTTWSAECGPDGPRGVAVDGERGLVFVACTDHVQVLDAKRDGARLGTLAVGAGLDNIDYLPKKRLLYAAAGKAARLVIARADDNGELAVVATIPTSEGARNAVSDERGVSFVADGPAARVWLVDAP
jgi:DNA-binding beta-propeller fold protein YncE